MPSPILDAIIKTMRRMGGEVRLNELTREMERLYPELLRGSKKPYHTIAGKIYAFSSDSKNVWLRGDDIFRLAGSVRGIWELRPKWKTSPSGRKKLSGASRGGSSHTGSILPPEEASGESFDPKNNADGLEIILQAIKARRGQTRFRNQLLAAYGERCAISGCDVRDTLEAAHIVPHHGTKTNHITNGLLLRADLHTLFDCGLVRVDPSNCELHLAASLLSSNDYKAFNGQTLRIPAQKAAHPSIKALEERERLMDEIQGVRAKAMKAIGVMPRGLNLSGRRPATRAE